MAELLVALSIFALISILGVSGFSFMLKNQIKYRQAVEDELIKEAKIYNCKKELYYLSKQTPDPPYCELQEVCWALLEQERAN